MTYVPEFPEFLQEFLSEIPFRNSFQEFLSRIPAGIPAGIPGSPWIGSFPPRIIRIPDSNRQEQEFLFLAMVLLAFCEKEISNLGTDMLQLPVNVEEWCEVEDSIFKCQVPAINNIPKIRLYSVYGTTQLRSAVPLMCSSIMTSPVAPTCVIDMCPLAPLAQWAYRFQRPQPCKYGN